MKRKEEQSVVGSIFITIVFAILAILTYQTDDAGNPLAWIPGSVAIAGIFMTFFAAIEDSNKKAKKEQQEKAARVIEHDKSFGHDDLKLYFDSSTNVVTICTTTTNGAKQIKVANFVCSNVVETDNYLVAVDSTNYKILKVKNDNGEISKKICNLYDELEKLGITHEKSTPSLKAYNDYAFVTDDKNEFVAIVTPMFIHIHRYSDIVSVSYEENGSNVFNKSLGGAVAGGLLFGGVGAIVGGNTAKTKQNKEVSRMYIKILLKSTSESTIILKIYNGPKLETKNNADRALYNGLMKEVAGIKDIFSIIIDIVDKKPSASHSTISPLVSSVSVASELEKLAKLKDTGILSEDEFREQKAKLLKI